MFQLLNVLPGNIGMRKADAKPVGIFRIVVLRIFPKYYVVFRIAQQT